MLDDATREVYWNIAGHRWATVLALAALGVFAWGLLRRVSVWLQARRTPDRLRRVPLLHGDTPSPPPIMRNALARWLHGGLLVAVLVLFAATTVVFIHEELGGSIMRGAFYLVFQSLLVDLAGLGAIVAIAAILVRGRVGARSLDRHRDVRPLLAAWLANLTAGFVLEGLRIAATQDPWAWWSPVGSLVAFTAAILPADSLPPMHRVLWWSHLVLSLGLLASIPYTSLAHLFLVPLNRLLDGVDRWRPRQEDSVGGTAPGDHEGAALRLREFTLRDLIDIDACVDCGRCDDACPVTGAGGPLSPREVMQGLQVQLRQGATDATLLDAPHVSAAAVWACTTCASCVDACPSRSAPLPKLLALRQGAMEQGGTPGPLVRPLESLQRWGNPFGEPPERRADWMLSLPRSAVPGSDRRGVLLYWVGCAGAYDPTIQRTTLRMAKLLHRANVPFVVLGNHELCCGDPARRTGEEGLFRALAARNVAAINALGPSRIVTHCAHCFHVLGREYPAFGARYPVVHHTELLAELSTQGLLGAPVAGPVTYHDPCYLGRQGGCFDAPREVLKAASIEVLEMTHAKRDSQCCGAGGGQMWLEAGGRERMNARRLREAADTGTETVITACPYCRLMLEDASTSPSAPRRMKVKDIVELFPDA